MKASEGLGDNQKQRLKKIWSFVCGEALLRTCRDVVVERVEYVKQGKKMEDARVVEINRTLNNLKIDWCSFWEPVDVESWSDVEEMILQHYLEHCLQDQLLERRDELVENAEQYPAAKEFLFEGMPEVVLKFVKGAGSSTGDVKKLL